MKTIDFSGVHLFSVTPTQGDESIAIDSLRRHLEGVLSAGIRSITVFGSTGGVGSFSEWERERVAEAAVRQAAGRVPVFAGTAALTTAETLRLTRHARDTGASAVLVVPMTYWRLTEAELWDHYAAIAGEGVPMIVYNNPGTTGIEMPVAFLARLCSLPAVVAVKDSSPDLSRIGELVRLTGDRIPVLTGRDARALDAMAQGSPGWFSAIANYLPATCAELHRLAETGQLDAARKRFERLAPLAEFALEKGSIRCAHEALEIVGRPAGAPRRPIQGLVPDDRSRLAELIAFAESATPG